jgi:hypothetical protein
MLLGVIAASAVAFAPMAAATSYDAVPDAVRGMHRLVLAVGLCDDHD